MNEVSETLLKGRITELKCELWFLEHGYVVSTPDLPYQYDLLVDIGNKILKIQVKTCVEETDGSGIIVKVCSMTHNSNGYVRRNYSADKVDYFMTYYKNNCYLIPITDCGVRQKKLRSIPPVNGQTKGINFLEDYLAEKILEKEKVVE